MNVAQSLVGLGIAAHLFKRVREAAETGDFQAVRYHRENFMAEDKKLAYGFYDAGSNAKFSLIGNFQSNNREVITLEAPDMDPTLEQTRKLFRSIDNPNASIEERTRKLTEFVANTFTGRDQRDVWIRMKELVDGDPTGLKIKLGEFIEMKSGVCRHRTMLMKFLADDVGLPMAMLRGKIDYNNSLGRHAWNHVTTEDGRVLIADASFNRVVGMQSRDAESYYTLEGHPTYMSPVSADSDLGRALNGLSYVRIQKGDRQGVELNIQHLSDHDRDLVAEFFSGNGIQFHQTSSSAQNGASVLRVFDPQSVEVVERDFEHVEARGYKPF